jgi:hypothetical protein
MPRGAGAGRPAEDAAIRIPDAVHRAIEELNRENAYIGRLYGAVMAGLAKLPYLQRTILHDFYIDGKRWDVVARRHNYGERHCQRIRDDGLTALGGLLAADPAAKKFFKK